MCTLREQFQSRYKDNKEHESENKTKVMGKGEVSFSMIGMGQYALKPTPATVNKQVGSTVGKMQGAR
jgi:hypothetical protein